MLQAFSNQLSCISSKKQLKEHNHFQGEWRDFVPLVFATLCQAEMNWESLSRKVLVDSFNRCHHMSRLIKGAAR